MVVSPPKRPRRRQRAPRPPRVAQHLAVDPAARRADGAGRDPRGGLRVHGLRQRALDARRQEEDAPPRRPRRSTSRPRARTTRTATRPEHDDAGAQRDRRQSRHLLEHRALHRRPAQSRASGSCVDAGSAKQLRRLVVRSDTPGFTAKIESGSSAGGPVHSRLGLAAGRRTARPSRSRAARRGGTTSSGSPTSARTPRSRSTR